MASIISKLGYLPYAWANYGKEELAEVVKCLKNCPLIPSFHTNRVERKVAHLFGHKYALAVNSGTSALILAAEVVKKFGPKRKCVVTPACTFVATISPFIQKGFKPLFFDVDWSYDIDMAKVRLSSKAGVVAFVVPNLSGSVADWEAINKKAKKLGAVVVEDSCDVIGHTYKGNKTGKYADISVTSFYAPHHITAAGGGGMFMTSKKEWYEYALSLREWGRTEQDAKNPRERLSYKLKYKNEEIPFDKKYVFDNIGYNFKPIEIGMAFAHIQLKKLKRFNKKRKLNVEKYQLYFRDKKDFFYPFQPLATTSLALYGYPITVKENAPFSRLELSVHLEENKIETRPMFVGDIRKQPAYRNVKFKNDFLSITEKVLRGGMLLPCHTLIDENDFNYLFSIIDSFLKEKTTI